MDKHIGEKYGCYTIVGISDKKAKDNHTIYIVECDVCHQTFEKQLSTIKYNVVEKCSHIKEELEPKFCKNCGKEILQKDNKTNNEFKRIKFCSHSCSATYGNQHRKKEIEPKYCLNCNKEIPIGTLNSYQYKERKYCSLKCSNEYKYKQKIKQWKDGEWDGTTGDRWIDISGSIKKYIFEKYNNQCARCGWNEINPYTGTLPLEIEHIDGDATNNKEENLILLCPNCHSLTATYRGANKGNGKRNITWLSRDCSKHKEFDI